MIGAGGEDLPEVGEGGGGVVGAVEGVGHDGDCSGNGATTNIGENSKVRANISKSNSIAVLIASGRCRSYGRTICDLDKCYL